MKRCALQEEASVQVIEARGLTSTVRSITSSHIDATVLQEELQKVYD